MPVAIPVSYEITPEGDATALAVALEPMLQHMSGLVDSAVHSGDDLAARQLTAERRDLEALAADGPPAPELVTRLQRHLAERSVRGVTEARGMHARARSSWPERELWLAVNQDLALLYRDILLADDTYRGEGEMFAEMLPRGMPAPDIPRTHAELGDVMEVVVPAWSRQQRVPRTVAPGGQALVEDGRVFGSYGGVSWRGQNRLPRWMTRARWAETLPPEASRAPLLSYTDVHRNTLVKLPAEDAARVRETDTFLLAWHDRGYAVASENPNSGKPLHLRVITDNTPLDEAIRWAANARTRSEDTTEIFFRIPSTDTDDLPSQHQQAAHLRDVIEAMELDFLGQPVRTTFLGEPPPWHDLVGLDAEGYPDAVLGDTDPNQHEPGWRYAVIELKPEELALVEILGPDSPALTGASYDELAVEPDLVAKVDPPHRDISIVDAEHPPPRPALIVRLPPWKHYHPEMDSGDSIQRQLEQQDRKGRPLSVHAYPGSGVRVMGYLHVREPAGGPRFGLAARVTAPLAQERGLPTVTVDVSAEPEPMTLGSDSNGWYLDVPVGNPSNPDADLIPPDRYRLSASGGFRSENPRYNRGLLISPAQLRYALIRIHDAGLTDEDLRDIAGEYRSTLEALRTPRLTFGPQGELVEVTVNLDDGDGMAEVQTVLTRKGTFQRGVRYEHAADPEQAARLVELAMETHADAAEAIEALSQAAGTEAGERPPSGRRTARKPGTPDFPGPLRDQRRKGVGPGGNAPP